LTPSYLIPYDLKGWGDRGRLERESLSRSYLVSSWIRALGLPPMILEMSLFGGCSDPEKKEPSASRWEKRISILCTRNEISLDDEKF
jgi:hypothetical protein